MSKYLIFRTDRIGDFIFSRMITDSIKKKNPNNIIDFVCSKYNSHYVKHYTDISEIYILDKYDLILSLKNIRNINKKKYDYIIILDGKRRSIFFSIFLKSSNKIAVLKDFRPHLLLKFFFKKYFINSEINSQYQNFSTISNYLGFTVPKEIKYYDNYNFKKKKHSIPISNFTLLHLDEKWFEGFYYDDFKYMNLNIKNFDKLIQTIQKKFKNKIVITSGKFIIDNLKKIIDNKFYKFEKNIFFSKQFKKQLIFVDNTDFRDLENIVKISSDVICCEGAISHVSNSLNKRTFALINDRGLNTGIFWTKHMKNINLIFRGDINYVCKQLVLCKK